MAESADPVIRWLDRIIKLAIGYCIAVFAGCMVVWALSEVNSTLSNKGLNDYRNRLCHEQLVCTKYKDTRQECAVAGDFNNCINVKMGGEPMYRLSCAGDGELASAADKADMPSEIECLLRDVAWRH
jgi:hypothetical protein